MTSSGSSRLFYFAAFLLGALLALLLARPARAAAPVSTVQNQSVTLDPSAAADHLGPRVERTELL